MMRAIKTLVGVAFLAVVLVTLVLVFPVSLTGAGSNGVASVDPSITPVSKSNPNDEAKRALDACGITAFVPSDVGSGLYDPANRGIDMVTGMGLITPARVAGKYAGLGAPPDIDPRLDKDQPAWVITTSGWFTDPWLGGGGTLEAPTCVVLAGDWAQPMWFVTGDSKDANGVVTTPLPAYAPVLRLPSPAP